MSFASTWREIEKLNNQLGEDLKHLHDTPFFTSKKELK